MQRISRVRAVLAVGILIVIPLLKESEITTASEPKRDKSALCVSSRRGNVPVAALLSFAGYRRVALGLPWEEISTSGSENGNSIAVPIIFGLPSGSGPGRSRALLAQTVDVIVSNNFFTPASVQISVGDTVRWIWQGSPHSVTSGRCTSPQYEDCIIDGRFCSPSNINCALGTPSDVGFIYSHQFNTEGTFRYFCNQHFALMTGTVIVATSASPTIQFSAGNFAVGEGGGAANITVSRSGTATSAATVDYATSDTAGLNNCSVVDGAASSRCDYPTSVGTVRFAAGETSKSISLPVVDDSYAEGSENLTITLSNATGVPLGSPTAATVTINDNETSNGANPIDGTPFFVRQQYIDFLNREPDPGGNAAWQSVINNCPPNDTTCDRIHVSSSFFLSPEFQGRGYFVYRFYPVSFGRKPDFVEFVPDIAKVSGFLSDAELEAAKVAFIAAFMSRPAFVAKFNALTDTQYVDTLLATAGVAPHQFRDFWIAALGNGTRTRATVLRDISESPEVYNKYFNQAFVVMQYFGYLRRDPDAFYLDWIAVLNSSSDHRGMVNGFMNSLEYRFRFGP